MQSAKDTCNRDVINAKKALVKKQTEKRKLELALYRSFRPDSKAQIAGMIAKVDQEESGLIDEYLNVCSLYDLVPDLE